VEVISAHLLTTGTTGIDFAALGVAAILAAVAAHFSLLHGMAVLFLGTHNAIMVIPSAFDGAHVRGGEHSMRE
jgi:hypothetical protein